MFIADYMSDEEYNKLRYSCTFTTQYKYWKEVLLEYCTKLFSWHGLPDSMPEREIELNLIMFGRCGINKNGIGKLIAVRPDYNGNTDYIDVFTNYTYATPISSGNIRIGKNGFVIKNNSIQNPLFDRIHHYSILLAHNEVSYINALINLRVDNLITAQSDQFKDGVQKWRKNVFEGKLDTLVDKGFSTIELNQLNANAKSQILVDLWNCRRNILSDFLEEIGVKHNNEKRERMIVDEVQANDNMLKLNIKDMFDARKKSVELFKEMFGLDVEVVCNVDLFEEKEVVADE